MKTSLKALFGVGLVSVSVLGAVLASADGLKQRLANSMQHIGDVVIGTGWTRVDQMVEMRDGVRLATSVYLPDEAEPPLATILVRLPYGKDRFGDVRYWVDVFTPRGYAVVAQDMRGRYGSEGVFAPYPNEGRDGADTLDWIVAQDWSSGQVGTIGCSALGEVQVILAAEQHPAHRAMIPIGAGGAAGSVGGRYDYFGAYDGGIFELASGFGWFVEAGGKSADYMDPAWVDYAEAVQSLPLEGLVARYREDSTDFDDFMTRFEDAAFWEGQGYITDTDQFGTPALMVDTWYDPSLGGTLAISQRMRDSGAEGQHVLIAPGTHCNYSGAAGSGFVGEIPVSPEAGLPFEQMFAAFMDHRLRGGSAPDLPPYRYYTLVEDRWRDADSWPPKETETRRFALGSDGSANSVSGDGWLRSDPVDQPVRTDSFISDPANPVPTLGGAICCTGDPELKTGPIAQNGIEGREDILIYTSAPLDEALRLVGPISAELAVSTDAPDTDLVVRLTDVLPDGTSRMIQEGALRLRYRDGFERPVFLEAGATYFVEVALGDIAYMLEPGHRLRLHVSGSSFPRLARNLNTGGNNYDEVEGRKATVRILSGGDTGSALKLSVLPD